MQEEVQTERLVKIQAAVQGRLPFAAALVAVLAVLAIYLLTAWLIYALAVHAWPVFVALVLLAAWWISRGTGGKPTRHAAPASALEREDQAPILGARSTPRRSRPLPHPDGRAGRPQRSPRRRVDRSAAAAAPASRTAKPWMVCRLAPRHLDQPTPTAPDADARGAGRPFGDGSILCVERDHNRYHFV
ncbi:MAG: hypothetical protein HC900_13180 [Methylacidiphilales bacterium]|nr:hypothetical protein [Candidatus Methylacidiphilales bacterium]